MSVDLINTMHYLNAGLLDLPKDECLQVLSCGDRLELVGSHSATNEFQQACFRLVVKNPYDNEHALVHMVATVSTKLSRPGWTWLVMGEVHSATHGMELPFWMRPYLEPNTKVGMVILSYFEGKPHGTLGRRFVECKS